jgi:hypothetical protein
MIPAAERRKRKYRGPGLKPRFCALVLCLSLSGCAEPPTIVPTAGKTPAERREIVYGRCLQEAAWWNFNPKGMTREYIAYSALCREMHAAESGGR